MGAYSFSMLSVPYLVVIGLAITTGSLALLIRGDALLKAAIFTVAISVLPWAIGSAVAASMTDPELIEIVTRYYIATVSLIGPAMLLLVLSVSGLVERYRFVLSISVLTAALSCVVAASTDLMIAGVWLTPSGLYFPRAAGPLLDLHIGVFVFWSITGIGLAQRGARQERTRRGRVRRRMVIVFLLLASSAASDLLLAHGIGFYPLSVVSATVALGVLVFAIVRQDLLHARGFDSVGAAELGAAVGVGSVTFAVVWFAGHDSTLTQPVVTVAFLLPLLVAAQAIVLAARRHRTARSEQPGDAVGKEAFLDSYIELCGRVRDHEELRRALVELLKTSAHLSRVRLYLSGDHGWTAVGHTDDQPVRIDARVRAWLVANPAPLIEDELRTRQLGGLRGPIEHFLSTLDADIVVPLVTRGLLVGAIATEAPGTGTLGDRERRTLTTASQATAGAIIYVHLLRDAEKRVEVAREIEVAAAVQAAQAVGVSRVSYPSVEIVSFYQPARRFGGDWSVTHELPDGRILVAIGDVTGHGVPAALISGTVLGACETAQRMLGAGFEVLAFLHLLNQSVNQVAGSQFAMSCFAALLDPHDRRVTFANAAHPFPYVCRPPSDDDARARLSSLISRGTPLGTRNPVLSAKSELIEPGDMLVFYSDSLVESRSPEGDPFGDRRLQRLLRNRAWQAGEGACELIIAEAHDHYRNRPLEDDIALVVAHIRGDHSARVTTTSGSST